MTASGVSVRFDDVFKAFDDTVVLAGVSLTVDPGEIFALLGPSGSGKTTMLRLLAGFEQLDRGRLLIADEAVEHLPPARRGVGMLFQSYALFPHLSVAENVAFGLKVRGGGQGETEARVAEMLELVRLSGFEQRRIAELSGGQQQRVALARALAPRPRVLLLDEPLSNLDPALREETRADLRRTVKQTGITTVLVTHEQEEAFELGERIGLLNEGGLEQVGGPAALYRDPASRFVATFVGRCSVLPGVVLERHDDSELTVRLESQPEAEPWRCRGSGELGVGDRVDVCARPEALELATDGGSGLVGRIEAERFTGSNSFYTVRLATRSDEAESRSPAGLAVEVAMPGTAAGRSGTCAVRQLAGEPPPSAFAAAGTESEP
ncbi:MAG: ABC transporter ATP-binding protein [Holophagales bacterium]|nr:ABC transporter ATP-binding protein [Holophagales bacterium]